MFVKHYLQKAGRNEPSPLFNPIQQQHRKYQVVS